jgi:small-conductance mechanosensitive channel
MENTNQSQILSQLVAFKNVHTEIEGIQNEIKKLKSRLKPRLDDLKKRYKELETNLISHLEKNNEPGIQYQDSVFLLSDKTPSSKRRINKEDAMIELFKKYNIQNPSIALEEVRKIFPIRESKKDDCTKKIQVKKTTVH